MNLYWKDAYTEAKAWVEGAYQIVAEWVYKHPMETDAIIVGGVLGSLVVALSLRARSRRRLRRILWGVRMKRSKNREGFEKSIISYGITDAIEEAVYRGDMTRDNATNWYHSFANYYGMTELLPVKNQHTVKRGIQYRLNHGVHRVKSIIPGGVALVKIDMSYQPKPVVAERKGTNGSKYANATA